MLKRPMSRTQRGLPVAHSPLEEAASLAKYVSCVFSGSGIYQAGAARPELPSDLSPEGGSSEHLT